MSEHRDYCRLLRLGVSICEGVLTNPSEEQLDRWHVEVAEPWRARMRARAEADHLRIDCRVAGEDELMASIGVTEYTAVATLARPDSGEPYFLGWYFDQSKLAAVLADYGDTLRNARRRVGVAAE